MIYNIDSTLNTRLVALQKSVIINKWEYAELLSRSDTGAPRPPLKSCKINTTAWGLCWRMEKAVILDTRYVYIIMMLYRPGHRGGFYRFPNLVF